MIPKEKLQELLGRLWEEHRPEVLARVEKLASLASSVRDGTVNLEQRKQARSAAHNLAGALGTFGRQQGTETARKLERILSGDDALEGHIETIEQAIADLRKAIN